LDNEKKGIFSWFNMRKANRPDAVAEDTTPTVKRYFKLLGRRFWQLVSLNIMMLPMIIPIIAIIYLYIGMRQTPIELTSAFSPLYGANLIEQTPTTAYMLDLFRGQLMIPVYTTTNYIFMAIFALLLAITFGWQNVGATYVLRGMVRGEAVFPFSDYFYAIKRNLKQGFFMGLIDFVVIFLLGFDLLYLWNAPVGLGNDLLRRQNTAECSINEFIGKIHLKTFFGLIYIRFKLSGKRGSILKERLHLLSNLDLHLSCIFRLSCFGIVDRDAAQQIIGIVFDRGMYVDRFISTFKHDILMRAVLQIIHRHLAL
jgi:hypothetical protein